MFPKTAEKREDLGDEPVPNQVRPPGVGEVSHFASASGKPKDTEGGSALMLVRTTGMWKVPQLTVKASDPGRRSNLTQDDLALEEDSRQSIRPKCQSHRVKEPLNPTRT